MGKNNTIEEVVTVYTKSELIDAAWLQAKNDGYDIQKGEAREIIDAFIEHIKDALIAGNSVKLKGFANFEAINVPARDGYNYLTGETYHSPEHNKLKITPSLAWKKEVAGK